jgi:aspartate--ammonia ligase
MLLLQKAHIGEVQCSVWSDSMREDCKAHGIILL